MIKNKSPEALERCGRALYGRNWKGQLRYALGIKNEARIRGWMSERSPIPPGIWDAVIELLKKRRIDIDAVLRDIE